MLETILLTTVLAMGPKQSMETPPPPTASKTDPNQTGRQPSAYTGKYFNKSMEPYRQCVAQREGRHQYWVTGSNGKYQSTYQMTDALVRGAAWMITPELKKVFGVSQAQKIRDTLLNTPGHKWARYYMDMAFWTVLNWDGQASGQHHWRGGRFSCHPNMNNWGGSR
jgi:hypothetical protein